MEAAVRWSPHATPDSPRFLVADVADPSLVLNEVDDLTRNTISYHAISRSGRLPIFSAFDWSKNDESVIALGLSTGAANLLKFRYDGQPCETTVQYRLKQQRKCNSISFSSQDWLAVAVDRGRSDIGLFVYDAKRENAGHSDTVRKLCAAETVSSVRFFPSQPQEIVASTQRQYIRLYDLRDGSNTSTANIQIASKNFNNLTIDPRDENYFASAGTTDDPTVAVWDRRLMSSSQTGMNSGAVFNLRCTSHGAVKTTVWSLRYSGQRRGRLAICSSTGELSVIDMTEAKVKPIDSLAALATDGTSSWTKNRYVSESRTLEHHYSDPKHGREFNTRTIAYDWITASDFDNLAGQSILSLRPNREVDVLRVPTSKPLASISGRNDLTLSYSNISMVEPWLYSDPVPANAPYEERAGAGAADFGPRDYAGEVATIDENLDSQSLETASRKVGKLLATSAVQSDRCRRGYLFDCTKNLEIVAGNWQLESLWMIINRFQELAANDGMTYGGLDMSYVGIAGLWSEEIGTSPNRNLSASPCKPGEAIEGVISAKDIPAFVGVRTNFPEHRQLCLAVCGWKFTTDALEAECQELIERGLYYQAVVQAVLHDCKHIALNILRTLIRERVIPNIGLGALLASDAINEEQREMSRWMAADTEDPALKALLTFLDTGYWRDVMKTNYLHLGYRLALGLKYLNDTELSGFIQTETARAVKNGVLEGVLLTGLCPQAMELFQTYILRTNDLQTAVLATSFTNPLYVDDVRHEMWKQTYFTQMQAWRCFIQRTKFTVQHNRMAKDRAGKSLLDTPPAQVTLQCLHCQNSIARNDSRFLNGRETHSAADPPTSHVTRVSGPPANAGTVCPKCGRHMPRCGLCQMWLGTPNPASPGGARELSRIDDIMAKMASFCKLCGHGFHADHARSWFEKHSVCPIPDCRCACGLYG